MPDILVTIRKFGEDTQSAVIREVMPVSVYFLTNFGTTLISVKLMLKHVIPCVFFSRIPLAFELHRADATNWDLFRCDAYFKSPRYK